MQAWRVALATVAAAGCVKIEPFRQRDAGSDGGGSGIDAPAAACDFATTTVSLVNDQGVKMVCGPHYKMRFSPDGANYPQSFVVDGHELLGTGDTCEDESGIGVGLYPAGAISGLAPPTNVTLSSHAFSVVIDTPFLLEIHLDWMASIGGTCGVDVAGHTTFTFFADGRIARGDEIVPSTTKAASSCRETGCSEASAASTWAVTTYLALAYAGESVTHTNPPTTVGASTQIQGYTLCVSGSGYHLGVSLPSEYNRLRRVATNTIAIVDDQNDTADLSGGLVPTRTMWIVQPAGCDENRVNAVAIDSQLTIAGAAGNRFGQATDGIFGGGDAYTGYPLSNAGDVMLSVAGGDPDLPAGWATWLQFPSTPSTINITQNGVALDAQHVHFQKLATDPSQVVFVFSDALTSAQSPIVISPQ